MKFLFCLAIIQLLLCSSILTAQTDDSWKLYDDSTLARIDISLDTASLRWMYGHVESDSEHYATIRFRNRWFDETIDSIGFRLRGNTSRYSQKKSFKVSFNSFIKGRTFHGVKKLNINGEHNDPSIIRSKLCFDLYNDIGVVASRASHTRLYINGDYYGLYISIEDVGEEFLSKNFNDDSGNLWKCLYPADLKYLGDDPLLYANLTSGGRPVYELQTNETARDFSQLARLIRAINTTSLPAMADSLASLLDLSTVLKYFAMNVLVGSWDDYRSLMNNYFLYYSPSKNQFTIIPYDYDNTFGVDWSGTNWTTADPYNFPKVVAGQRPLSETIFAQNKYKDLFTHFLEFYNARVMPVSRWESHVDRIRDTITTAASEDLIRTKDYGFTMTDFTNSYTSGSYHNQHVKFGLKQFVNLRTASLPSQLVNNNAPPQVYDYSVAPSQPGAHDSLLVTASCFGKSGIKSVTLLHTRSGESTSTDYPMSFEPVPNTLHVEEADRWVVSLPPLGWGANDTLQFQVTDSLNRTLVYPRVQPCIVRTPAYIATGLVINEILADNKNVNVDQDGGHDDWIELYNPTDSAILLTGKYMTDKATAKTKWKFTKPNLTINPGEYLLVWCDEEELQEGIHTNFKLSANGEYAAIIDTDGVTIIDSTTFGAQTENISFGRYPSGGGVWGKMTPTPGATNTIPNDVRDNDYTPGDFSLSGYPNPFNSSTILRYVLPSQSRVRLKVYDITGKEIALLFDDVQQAGNKEYRWSANGRASGIYFCRLEAVPLEGSGKTFSQAIKLVLMQ